MYEQLLKKYYYGLLNLMYRRPIECCAEQEGVEFKRDKYRPVETLKQYMQNCRIYVIPKCIRKCIIIFPSYSIPSIDSSLRLRLS